MYCPRCGRENVGETGVCSSCGGILTSSSELRSNPDAKASGLAIASLVLGILSYFTCFVTAIPAIILGIVGLVKIGKSGGRLKGQGLAIAGITVPALGVVILPAVALLMGILMPGLARVRQISYRMVCATNMSGLGKAIDMYANDFDGRYPTASDWCDLLIEHTGIEERQFTCRGTRGEVFSYGFNKNLDGLRQSEVPPDIVVLFEIEGGRNISGGSDILSVENHQGEGCNVLFADGYVGFYQTEDIEELKWEP